MKKCDKLVRSLRQILNCNYEKIRSKVGFVDIAKHLDGIYMFKHRQDEIDRKK